ncbi:hypothetical protein [Prochlorococcus marinus]|uniref:hypothetical protein n=1 Tax=Prochlorococcus marinus TaxID=1219 RepID=UPI001AD98BEC|nr:hypothetical protein [Prochlorococcus marinus]MBO8219718.1 hypothetical protein [Prochlorococcus marinus CUG1416]MBW3052080.1 hypothetical protein [Prochlorococcus marinus str. MU1416]
MKRLTTQFLIQKLTNLKPSLDNFFIILILLGIPLNLYKNRFYDSSWTVGEWLISYAGGFVRRGLPGQIIHHISNEYLISPILLVWIFSVLAFISLAILLLHFCKDLFDKSFLLSQVILLAPISENYLIRKDTLLVLLYGLSLLVIKKFNQEKISKFSCILFVNLFSIIGILSHEAYGIWGLPSLIVIFYLLNRGIKKGIFRSILFALFYLIPSIISFAFCWIFKGDVQQALLIHESWQNLKDILPSIWTLNESKPYGAIAAIGWGTSQIYTSSLFSQFNLFIFWHPGMWLLTMYIVLRLFIGKKHDPFKSAKRSIVCLQLIAFLPLFLFVDIGRWIYMWLSSSALLFAFLIKVFGIKKILFHTDGFKGARFLKKIIPTFASNKTYNIFLLSIGLPHCCWSIGRYIVSNPIGFGIKNIIFYFKFLFA